MSRRRPQIQSKVIGYSHNFSVNQIFLRYKKEKQPNQLHKSLLWLLADLKAWKPRPQNLSLVSVYLSPICLSPFLPPFFPSPLLPLCLPSPPLFPSGKGREGLFLWFIEYREISQNGVLFYNLHQYWKNNCFGPGSPIGRLSESQGVRYQDDTNLSHILITVAKMEPGVLLLGVQTYWLTICLELQRLFFKERLFGKKRKKIRSLLYHPFLIFFSHVKKNNAVKMFSTFICFMMVALVKCA